MILLNAHTKGGVSKTTTTINLATKAALENPGDPDGVIIVDIDPGQSAREWWNERAKRGITPGLMCVTLFGSTVRDDIKRLAKKYKHVIIDAGGEGRGAPEIRLALTIADKVLTPCRPPSVDTKRLKDMRTMIAEAKTLNPKLDAMLFPTQASTHPSATDVINFYRNVADYTEFRILETVMRNRSAYQHWVDTGKATFESHPQDKAAAAEIDKLYAEVFK